MLFQTLLIIHIAAGTIATTSGFASFIVPKFGPWHPRLGKVFFYAMLVVAFTAFGMCILHFNVFLFLVGLLSFYTDFTGYRYLRFYKRQAKAGMPDYVAAAFVALLLLAGWGLVSFHPAVRLGDYGIVLGVFSVFLGWDLWLDFNMWRKDKVVAKEYLKRHIERMGATFIASVTAPLVVNVHTDPVFIAWLAPTVLITPIITYYVRQLKSGALFKKTIAR